MQRCLNCLQPVKRFCHASPWKLQNLNPARCRISQHSLYNSQDHFLCTSTVQIKQHIDDYVHSLQRSSHAVDKQTIELCHTYANLTKSDKKEFLLSLAKHYHVNHENVAKVAQSLNIAQGRGEGIIVKIEERLRKALTPTYQHVFQHISHMQDGVKFLVDMRADVLRVLSEPTTEDDQGHLQAMDQCLRYMLSMWFAVGFLKVERVTWQSSCDLMQKVSEYEAVHPVRNWMDLKSRVGPYRRCYIFTHNTMPDEPIVLLHVALTKQISDNIQSIIQRPSRTDSLVTADSDSVLDVTEDITDINTAIFYSVTSTQKGLQGIEMGNYLIKKVVQELMHELPSISQFSSLSPIPGYREWLLLQINKHYHELDEGKGSSQALFTNSEWRAFTEHYRHSSHMEILSDLKRSLGGYSWAIDQSLKNMLKKPLTRLCARYLYLEKRRKFAMNPVANFHLRNGAILWRINWMADTSPRGLTNSCGLMVNYKYELNSTDINSQNYMTNQEIPVSASALKLVNIKLNE